MGSLTPSPSHSITISTPPRTPLQTAGERPLHSPPSLRSRKTIRRLPTSLATSPSPRPRGDEQQPPFVHRSRRPSNCESRTSRETPPEIKDSIIYAQICETYLCGWAGSIVSFAEESEPDETSEMDHCDHGKDEVIQQAVEALKAEFARFEADHVAWAGCLMEGSEVDDDRVSDDISSSGDKMDDDGERGRGPRQFVKEGMEIMFALERAKREVDRVAARFERKAVLEGIEWL